MNLARPSILVIGGSAGSIDVLLKILPKLPKDFPLPIAVVLHFPPDGKNLMPELISSHAVVPAKEVEDKEPLQPGRVYFAPPNYHLLVEKNRTFALSNDEPVQFSRPSIDVFFESVAEAYGDEAIALLLSGASEDGVRGLQSISEKKGQAIVQNPKEALVDIMPKAAISRVPNARVVSIDELSNILDKLLDEGAANRAE